VLNGLIKQDLFSDETEFFTEVLKSAGVGFWTYDHATDSNVWSAQLLALLGGDEGDVPKGFTEWFDLIHPEDQPRVQSCMFSFVIGIAKAIGSGCIAGDESSSETRMGLLC
jgi:hypothetical protein